MSAPPGDLAGYAVKSYRYLRLSIVVVVLALVAAVIIERLRTTCFEGSFSAYYYTPAHSMFVGALVVIGVCLIAIKAVREVEDMLLNVAGMLAPVVAFIPTKAPNDPKDLCTRHVLDIGKVAPFVGNNIVALAVGGAIAVVMAMIIEDVGLRGSNGIVAKAKAAHRTAVIGLLLTSALITAGVLWYVLDHDGFIANGHYASAIAMFALIGVVVVINARCAGAVFRPWYWAIFVFMLVSAVVVGVAKFAGHWHLAVLAIEALLASGFGAFWIAQTIEHWDAGIVGTSDQ
jgi:hypothetical protein